MSWLIATVVALCATIATALFYLARNAPIDEEHE